MKGIEDLRRKISPDIFLIEDCAQAMGSKIGERQVGNFSDVSFFSFNRGKNLSVSGGGCITTDSKELSEKIYASYKLCIKNCSLRRKLFFPFKALAISLASNPFIYGLGYPFISQFKEKRPPTDFAVEKISNFQTALGSRLLEGIDISLLKRYQNGMFLINSLKDLKGLIIPQILKNSMPVFNRFPLLF